MSSSLHRPEYEIFRRLLIRARQDAGLTQVEVAARLKKPQSFVSKVERGERRLDLPEFIQFADAAGIDAAGFIETFRVEVSVVPKNFLS